jgi:dUTP pyrophosphatase
MRKRNTVAAMAASTDKNPLNISKLSAEERAWFASNSVPSFDAASTVNSGTKTTSATTTTTTTTTVVADDVVEEGIRKRVRSSRADVNPPPQLSSTREEREWLLQQVATREANAHDLSSARPKNVKVNIAANQPAPTSLPQLTLEEENEKCFGDAFPSEKSQDVAPDLGQTKKEQKNPEMILPFRGLDHFSIILLRESAEIPRQHGSKKSLWDLSASEPSFIPAGTTGYVTTGLIIIPPLGKFTQLHSRSGMAAHGVTVEGGIIDEDYKKEVFIILKNSTPHNITIQAKERVAQFSFYDNPAGWYTMRVQNETTLAPPPPQRKNIERPVDEGMINEHAGGEQQAPWLENNLSQKETFGSFPAFMQGVKNQENPGVLDPNDPKRMAEPWSSRNRGFGSTGYF